jgi:hypothetical protein
MTEPGTPATETDEPPKAPRWAKIAGGIALLAVLLIAALLLLGGGNHGPGRHSSGGWWPSDCGVDAG